METSVAFLRDRFPQFAPGVPERAAIERDAVPSMILWGPPGSGKTTLALALLGLVELS